MHDQFAKPEQKIYYPNRYKLVKQPIAADHDHTIRHQEESKTIVKPGLDLDTLVQKMRAADGVEIKDRRYLFNLLRNALLVPKQCNG
jgi:hypothetical protein